MEHCMCNVYPQTHLYPKTLLDTKDSILALLEVTRIRLFKKVLGELVCQLDQLQHAKPKHKSENSPETRQKLQKVHSWHALVHLHLQHQCRGGAHFYRDSIRSQMLRLSGDITTMDGYTIGVV